VTGFEHACGAAAVGVADLLQRLGLVGGDEQSAADAGDQ